MRFRLLSFPLLLLVVMLAAAARADSPGQDDLDKATESKIKARTLRDLGGVIKLCESAQQKGLDKQGQDFAKQLLASTLIQRGLIVARQVFEDPTPDPDWPRFRDFALADLERAVTLDSKQAEALLFIARLHLLPGGKPKRAREALDQAVAVGDATPDVRAKALILRAGMVEDPKRRRADLDEAVRTAPGDPSTFLTRGLFLADLGEFDRSLADLQKAIELKPKHAAAYEAKAMVLAKQKKYDQALVDLDKAHELEPNSVYPMLQQARIHLLQKNHNGALHALSQAEAAAPNDVNLLLLRAGVFQEMNQKDKALAEIDRALKLKPKFGPAIRARAMLLAGEGKLTEAIAEMERFRKHHPKDRLSLVQLALLYAAQNQLAEAIKTYSEVLADEPNNFLALRGRGDSLLGVGRHAEAIADYEKAVKIEDDDASLLNNFAWVLATSPDAKLRNGKRALQFALQAAKRTEYKQAHILSTLAAAYAEAGDMPHALDWAKKAVASGSPEQKEELAAELASYQAGKPWRERQTGDKPARQPPKANIPDKPLPKKK
jgi:tetratricopeptide (TPR) repeat protein